MSLLRIAWPGKSCNGLGDFSCTISDRRSGARSVARTASSSAQRRRKAGAAAAAPSIVERQGQNIVRGPTRTLLLFGGILDRGANKGSRAGAGVDDHRPCDPGGSPGGLGGCLQRLQEDGAAFPERGVIRKNAILCLDTISILGESLAGIPSDHLDFGGHRVAVAVARR